MKWELEQWRKLYLREPIEQLLWPLLTRSLRDYLIRRASDTGVIFPRTADPGTDLCQALGAHDMERDMVHQAVLVMLADGFLVHGTDGTLVIRNLRDAQERRTKEAARKARQRAKKSSTAPNGTPGGTHDGTPNGSPSGTVPRQTRGSDPIRSDPIRVEEKRGDNPDTAAVAETPEGQILAELRRHPALAPVATIPVARMLATRFATAELQRGVKFAWVVEAIRDADADCATGGLTAEAMARKLRTYCDNAKPSREREHTNGHAKNYDSQKLSPEQRAAEQAAAQKRMAANAAAVARIEAEAKEASQK